MDVAGNAGVVHQNVHWSEIGRDPGKEFVDRHIICDVTLRRQRASATLANRGLERPRSRVLPVEGEADGGAALRQHVDDAGADAAGAAGDDGDAAVEGQVGWSHGRDACVKRRSVGNPEHHAEQSAPAGEAVDENDWPGSRHRC